MVNIAKGAGEPGDTVGGAIFQTAGHVCAFVPATRCARVMPVLCPSLKKRGRRESRVSDAPAAPRAKVESTWVGTTGSPVQTGFPCAMVLTACFVLSPVTGLSCHRRLAETPAKLDASVGASGPHDFAVRISIIRPRAIRAPDAAASTASRTYVRDDHDTPLCVGRDGRVLEVIWVGGEAKYFSRRGWTANQ